MWPINILDGKIWSPGWNPWAVHQLLGSQSALMFLTMGGVTGASSYHHSLGGSPVGARTPGESTADLRVMGTSGSLRKRSHQLLPRDSGSSLGSEAGITHSLTFPGTFMLPVTPVLSCDAKCMITQLWDVLSCDIIANIMFSDHDIHVI